MTAGNVNDEGIIPDIADIDNSKACIARPETENGKYYKKALKRQACFTG